MSELQLTSEQWAHDPEKYVANIAISRYTHTIFDAEGCMVARVTGVTRDQADTRARVITATPKLLALAQHILAMADDAHFNEHPEWQEIVAEAQVATKDIEQ